MTKSAPPAGTVVTVGGVQVCGAGGAGLYSSYNCSGIPYTQNRYFLPSFLQGTTLADNVYPPPAAQTISFSLPSSLPYAPQQTVALAATSSSGLPVTFSVGSGPATIQGSTLTIPNGGTITVNASQAGNHYFSPATAQQTISIPEPMSCTITTSSDEVIEPGYPTRDKFAATVHFTGSATIPTGTVSFSVDGTNYGGSTGMDSTGTATIYSTNGAWIGQHEFAAVYTPATGVFASPCSVTTMMNYTQ